MFASALRNAVRVAAPRRLPAHDLISSAAAPAAVARISSPVAAFAASARTRFALSHSPAAFAAAACSSAPSSASLFSTPRPLSASVCLPALPSLARAYTTPAVMDELLHKAQHNRVSKILQADPRVRMPASEFYALCEENGIPRAEADQLSRSLHDCGIVLRFTSAPLSDILILKPAEITQEFVKMIDHEGEYTERYIKHTRQELKEAEEKLTELNKLKADYDALAYRKADRLLALGCFYLVAQGAIVARLTWWELSWDIMEPITYLITFSTSVIAIFYFSRTKREFTYDSLRERLAHARMKKIYANNGFDEEEWRVLTNRVVELRRCLEEPEVYLLKNLGRQHQLAYQAEAAAEAVGVRPDNVAA